MVALLTVFFMPEIVKVIGIFVFSNSQFVAKIFWDAMDAREKTGVARGDFIDSLVKLKNGEQNVIYSNILQNYSSNMLGNNILSILLEFKGDNLFHQTGTFLSGFETSSTTASFTLMELARKTECQDRARIDVLKSIEKHGWTYNAFINMKYLDKCVAEGQRLHPSISTIDRHTLEDYKVKF